MALNIISLFVRLRKRRFFLINCVMCFLKELAQIVDQIVIRIYWITAASFSMLAINLFVSVNKQVP